MSQPEPAPPLVKYEALGNDYLVADAAASFDALAGRVMAICDRHLGVGSDGLLLLDPGTGSVRILNPDGSEAEKSGNGLRIAAAHMVLAHGAGSAFVLRPPAGPCAVRVISADDAIVVSELEVGVPQIRDRATAASAGVEGVPVSVGNPHFVVFGEPVTEARARALGPVLESDRLFPARTNVQLCEVLDRGRLRIEIWERGAGYTLASGTSAAAAAAAAMSAGLVGDEVEVSMPGGVLRVRRRPDGMLLQEGPARRVFEARGVFAGRRMPAGG